MVMNINKKHVDRQTPECRSLAERLQTVARRRRREVDRHAGCMQVACSRSATAALGHRLSGDISRFKLTERNQFLVMVFPIGLA
jgi:hypothetical protein